MPMMHSQKLNRKGPSSKEKLPQPAFSLKNLWHLSILLMAPLAVQCAHPASQSKSTSLPEFPSQIVNSWEIASLKPQTEVPAFLGDGTLAAHFGPLGDGSGLSGNNSLIFIAGNYRSSEKIAPVPNPMVVTLKINNVPASPGSNYRQTLDFQRDQLVTQWDQQSADGQQTIQVTSKIQSDCIICSWKISSTVETSVSWLPIPFALKTTPLVSLWTKFPTWSLFGNEGLQPVPLQPSAFKATIPAQGSANFTYILYLPIAQNGWLESTMVKLPAIANLAKSKLAVQRALAAPDPPFADIRVESSSPQDQLAIRSFLFDLRCGEGYPLSPFGLTNSLYDGHVFWDADTWMAPALDFLDPNEVRKLCQYRYLRLGKDPNQPWPWESSVSGKNVATVMNREIHIVGDVLWQLQIAHALGINTESLVDPLASCQKFWKGQLSKLPSGKYGINHVVSPDENHTGNNDLYTNLLAQWTLNGMKWNPKSAYILHLPHDNKTFLTYDNDPVRSYKQAAAILSLWPLQYPPAVKESAQMLQRFGDKTLKHGPAMSGSILALLLARQGEAENAYKSWQKSWQPYMSGPFLTFNEKPVTTPMELKESRNTFMTGAAGCLDAVLYGFAGLEITRHPSQSAEVKVHLEDGYWLTVQPHLPPAWSMLQLANIQILGKSYNLTIEQKGQTQNAQLTSSS